MTGRLITQQLQRMRRDWDRRARENAHYFVATEQDEWTEEEFYRSGEMNIQELILTDMQNICQGKDPKQMKVLEIGCGAGRLTRALGRVFGQVYAVDISREMVLRARRAMAGESHIHIVQNNGRDLGALRPRWWNPFQPRVRIPMDFAFSYIVFQHIPNREIIENYIREVNTFLRPGGLFKFQVQGGAKLESTPDDSWVGASFTESDAREMAERCGFEMRFQDGAGEQYYWLWYFKTRELGPR